MHARPRAVSNCGETTCPRRGTLRLATVLAGVALMVATGWIGVRTAHAEYGDVVINNYSDEAGMRPVIFPHWFHRIRFRCKVCHADLGFQFKAARVTTAISPGRWRTAIFATRGSRGPRPRSTRARCRS